MKTHLRLDNHVFWSPLGRQTEDGSLNVAALLLTAVK